VHGGLPRIPYGQAISTQLTPSWRAAAGPDSIHGGPLIQDLVSAILQDGAGRGGWEQLPSDFGLWLFSWLALVCPIEGGVGRQLRVGRALLQCLVSGPLNFKIKKSSCDSLHVILPLDPN
jgi:hypothetical protein